MSQTGYGDLLKALGENILLCLLAVGCILGPMTGAGFAGQEDGRFTIVALQPRRCIQANRTSL